MTVSATGATPTGTVAVKEGTTTLCTITGLNPDKTTFAARLPIQLLFALCTAVHSDRFPTKRPFPQAPNSAKF